MFRLKMTRCCLLIFEIIIENIEVVIRVTLTLFYVLPIILSFSSQPFSSPDSPCSFSVVLPINLLLLIHWHRVNKQAVKVFSSHHSTYEMSTSPLFWLRPLFICLTSQLYLWEYIWSSQQILISLFGFLQIKAHSSKFNLVFRSHLVLKSLRKFGLALNLWKWQCSEGVVWFGFNELFLSLFPDNSWCPWFKIDIHQQLRPLTANYLAMFKVISTTIYT